MNRINYNMAYDAVRTSNKNQAGRHLDFFNSTRLTIELSNGHWLHISVYLTAMLIHGRF